MEKEISDYILKLTGGVSLLSPLGDIDKECEIRGKISIYSQEDRNNEDGTYSRCYKGKFTQGISIQEGEKIIKVKDKRKNSQRIRLALAEEWKFRDTKKDFEQFYDEFTNKLIHNLPEVLELLNKNL